MTDYTDRPRSRRSVLRTVGAVAGLGVLSGRAAGRSSRTVEVNVGYAAESGLDAALSDASVVVHRFGFDALTVRLPERAVERLADRSDVRYVETNRSIGGIETPQQQPPAPTPDGQTTPYGIERVGADVARENGFTGAGAAVSVIDTGIDSTHPDLEANLGSGRGFVPGISDVDELDFPPGQDDDVLASHGSHCAGTVGAADNDVGVVGVSPGARLHAAKALVGGIGAGTDASIAAGIEFVADRGFDVANLSLGAPEPSPVLEDAVTDAYERGVLLVAAAGNEGTMPADPPASMTSSTVGFPAAYEEVIAVGATDRNDDLAPFSSTGPEVDIVAPGVDVLSTALPVNIESRPERPFRRYIELSGTSFASPHVAGAGALLMADGYSNAEARERLEETAEDVGLDETEGGAGRLDVAAALGVDSSADR